MADVNERDVDAIVEAKNFVWFAMRAISFLSEAERPNLTIVDNELSNIEHALSEHYDRITNFRRYREAK